MKIRSILLPLAAIIICAACSSSPQLNSSNIDQVVKAMTRQEKVSLLLSCAPVSGTDSSARFLKTAAIERLGIPAITLADFDTVESLSGVDFPSPLMLAGSWDKALIEEVYACEGHMAADAGVDVLMEPSLNIIRNQLAGNTSRNYSEDPIVSGKTAAAAVRGISSAGEASAVKYLAAANQTMYGDRFDACVSARTLREIYLKGFELALGKSSPAAVVAAGNKLNGTYTAANKDLLTGLLRDEYKFEGAVIGHSAADDFAPKAIEAGSSLLWGATEAARDTLLAYLEDGRLSAAALDSSVRAALKMIVSTRSFHQPQEGQEHPEPDFAATSRKAAAESIILLENRYNALPLIDSLGESVVVFESCTDSLHAIKPALERELAAAGIEIAGSRDSADIALVVISRRAKGCDRKVESFELSAEEKSLIENTCREYQDDDKFVVALLNIDAPVETASWKELPDAILLAFEGGSQIGGAVSDIITGKVTPSGKLTLTLANNYIDFPSARNFPVRVHRPDGQHPHVRDTSRRPRFGGPGAGFWSGRQRPDSLRGRMPRRSRSGFMPQIDSATAAKRGQRNIDYTVYQEGIFVGYRFFSSFEREVSYPFGYGLSYTEFEYGEPDVILKRNSMRVFVQVSNVGKYQGREVVQLYAVTPEGSLDKPLMVLLDYKKTPLLAPGQSCTVMFDVPLKAFASYNSASAAWMVDAGSYILKIGSSVADIRSEAAVVLDDTYSWRTGDVLQQQYPINELHLRRSIFRERARMRDPQADSIPQQTAPAAAAPDSVKGLLK